MRAIGRQQIKSTRKLQTRNLSPGMRRSIQLSFPMGNVAHQQSGTQVSIRHKRHDARTAGKWSRIPPSILNRFDQSVWRIAIVVSREESIDPNESIISDSSLSQFSRQWTSPPRSVNHKFCLNGELFIASHAHKFPATVRAAFTLQQAGAKGQLHSARLSCTRQEFVK